MISRKYLRVTLIVASIGVGFWLLAASPGKAILESTSTRRDTFDAHLCFHASAATDTMPIALPFRRSGACSGNE